MNQNMNSSDDDLPPEKVEESKKMSRLSAAIMAAIFVLGVVLPPAYKPFVPFLLLIPLIIALINKFSRMGSRSEDSAQYQGYSPPVQEQDSCIEPYSYTPKDPKDPRRYKPIG